MLAAACGLEAEPPVDDEGEPIPLPDPGEDWLFFEDFSPAPDEEDIPVRPTITITLNDYVDPSTFRSFDAARLVSGGIGQAGRVEYRMTRKQILFRPTSALEPDLRYTFQWRADGIESVVGSPLHPRVMLPRYRTGDAETSDPPPARPAVSWREVEELFDVHCNHCHADSDWKLPALTRQELLGRKSDQVDALLVEPFHPARSYLMHKILPDYPIRRHTEQPPPWSEDEPLSLDDIELVEHWIAIGAPP